MNITTVTTKQYAFCDDIKKHILSFLAPKKMRLVNLFDEKIQALLIKCMRRESVFSRKARLYQLRMLISKEQLDYERSDVGIKHRKKHNAAIKIASDRKMVITDLENYWRDERRGGTGEFRVPISEYGIYLEALYWNYKDIVIGTHYEIWSRERRPLWTPKDWYLSYIILYGEQYTQRANLRFKKAKQAEARKEKAKEKIACGCGCGKMLTRPTVSRHIKLRAQGR